MAPAIRQRLAIAKATSPQAPAVLCGKKATPAMQIKIPTCNQFIIATLDLPRAHIAHR